MKMINKDLKIIISLGAAVTAALSVCCLFFSPICALLCLMMGIILTAVFTAVTYRRYKKLNKLNDYLSLVCSGYYDLDIGDNSEGELSILKNNLYKVITILKAQNEMLAKDKAYLADSLADISHQLKTPLTSMMVMTDLLKDERDGARQAEFLGIIECQLDKMKWLITNLLKLSKLDAGMVEFKKEVFSSQKLIAEGVKPFLVTLDLKGIEFVNRIDDFSITGDLSWSVEAVGNIIKNCIEHTDKNGRLTISGESTVLYDSITIRDNGCGIAKEDLPHIFERFYHGKNSSKDSVGIGLALAKAVFEKENASISVKSTENMGTEFEIRFYKAIV